MFKPVKKGGAMHPIMSIIKSVSTERPVEIEELDIIVANPSYVDTHSGVDIKKTKIGFLAKTVITYEHNCLTDDDLVDVVIPDGVYLVTTYKSDDVLGTLYVENGKGEVVPY